MFRKLDKTHLIVLISNFQFITKCVKTKGSLTFGNTYLVYLLVHDLLTLCQALWIKLMLFLINIIPVVMINMLPSNNAVSEYDNRKQHEFEI